MSLLSGAGDQAAKTIAQALQDALGRELQDAEKLAAVLAQGIVDHVLAGVRELLASQKLTIQMESKDKSS